jgi:hypothetical protein
LPRFPIPQIILSLPDRYYTACFPNQPVLWIF